MPVSIEMPYEFMLILVIHHSYMIVLLNSLTVVKISMDPVLLFVWPYTLNAGYFSGISLQL